MARPFTSPPPARPEAVVVPGPEAEPEPRSPWPGWMGPVALVSALFATTMISIVVIGILGAAGVNVKHPDKRGLAVALTYIQDFTFIATVLFFARLATRPARPVDLGLRFPSVRRTVKWVVLAVLAYALFSLAFALVVHPKSSDDLFHSLGIHKHDVGPATSLAILVCVIAPIAEELLFRGFMFAALLRWGGPWVASLIVGLLFGIVHVFGTPAILLVQLAALGFIFCIVRWRTGSILPTIALHAINNALAFASLEGWTWQAAPLAAGAAALALTFASTGVLLLQRRRSLT